MTKIRKIKVRNHVVLASIKAAKPAGKHRKPSRKEMIFAAKAKEDQ